LPACPDLIVQVPALRRLAVAPDSVQTVGVLDTRVTGRPDEAVAMTGNAGVPKGTFGSGPKAMVWVPCVTWKVWLTAGAAAKMPLPACVAWTVQVPTAASVTVVPDSVQAAGVMEAKLTVKPEDAVAFTVNGAAP